MKVKVKVQDQYYEVEILDINTRPVRAIVDGVEFEVWPQDISSMATAQLSAPSPAGPAGSTSAVVSTPRVAAPSPLAAASNLMSAPIPGVVVAVKVHVGDMVSVGQELLILEAMKMRNTIRSPRDGQIAVVHVANGQTVNHNDPLIEFAELAQSGA
jgi:biotin carboxyl carrier protein